MTWTESDRVVGYRERWRAVDVAVEVLDGWRRHVMSRNAAVLTYYGFLSIFPLFMVATAVLALVLRGNERLKQEILDTAVAQIPVLGSQIQDQAGELSGDWITLIIGLGIALWAATRAFAGVQMASDDAWEIHVDGRDNLAIKRLKALLGIVIIGSGVIAGTAVSSIASVANLPFASRILLVLGTLAINTAVAAATMRVLTTAEVAWSMVWPGAVLAGVSFTVLQILGVTIVTRFLASASDTAGVFAGVFALMAWINLHAMASLAGIELNAALDRLRRGVHARDVVTQGSSTPVSRP